MYLQQGSIEASEKKQRKANIHSHKEHMQLNTVKKAQLDYINLCQNEIHPNGISFSSPGEFIFTGDQDNTFIFMLHIFGLV